MFDNIYFAKCLKETREIEGITITKMSKKLGVNTDKIKRIESGENITVKTLASYLEAIGLDMNDVFR